MGDISVIFRFQYFSSPATTKKPVSFGFPKMEVYSELTEQRGKYSPWNLEKLRMGSVHEEIDEDELMCSEADEFEEGKVASPK